jgi:septal ring factor EnvC (AmiA/AmiB activator)
MVGNRLTFIRAFETEKMIKIICPNSFNTKYFIVATLLLLLGAPDAWGFDGHQIGIVNADEITVLSEPSKNGFLQKTLTHGTEIEIINRRQGWLQILHDGEVGFIRDQAQSVKIVHKDKINTGNKNLEQPENQQKQVDIFEKRKKYIRREIEKGKQEVEAFTRKESDIIQRLNEVELALNKSRKRTAALKAEIKKLDSQINESTLASAELRKRIQANEGYVAKRLVAVYKMNWLGKFHLLASADSMHEFIQRRAALERILAFDEKIRRDLVKNQAEFKAVLARLEAHKTRKTARAADYEKQIRLMSRERSLRKKLLADIRSQKKLELAAIDALTQSAVELDDRIKLLNTRTNGAAGNKNISRLPFSAHKGLLIMPVNGKIINLFGAYKNPKYNITNFRSGIEIKADTGEPIRSVFSGKVLYSSWFKGYGNMIIVDHGKNYYTVYAHLEEAFKAKGDIVETGEVIATVGDTGSMTGTKLYFEVRHHGKPMNPLEWLKKG